MKTITKDKHYIPEEQMSDAEALQMLDYMEGAKVLPEAASPIIPDHIAQLRMMMP